jgi:CBS domain-containing protein
MVAMSSREHVNRLERLTVADIMIPIQDYPKVSPRATLRETIVVMEAAQLCVAGRCSLPRVLLVCDDDGHLMGHVRRRDVIRGLEPKFLLSNPLNYSKRWFNVDVDPLLSELSTERVVKEIRERSEHPVTEVMLPMKGSVRAEDPIMVALYEMQSLGVPLLPVRERGKPVMGLVRTVEIFAEISLLVI